MANAPGLKRRKRADGTTAYYWVAAAASRRASAYPLKTIRIHAETEDQAIGRAFALNVELQAWLADQDGMHTARYLGTLSSLIDCYERDEDSPYRTIKANTRRHYDQILQIVKAACGDAQVAQLTRKDFARWYRGFRAGAEKAAADGTVTVGPERVRQAHNCMKLIRIVINYGASMRYEGCRDAAMVLGDMRFDLPPPRRTQLAYEQASAIIDAALAGNRPSIALAQALQFELSLRQKDVIGEWSRVEAGKSGIIYHGLRWANGVLWTDLSADLVLTKQTTKTAAIGQWDLTLYPLVMKALACFPADKRVGPMIVSESTAHPYRSDDYRVKWRALARKAGVPDDVWNMDSRAGGITEADEAGAEPRDMQRHATHTNFNTTSRYVRGTLRATEKVARLRVAQRGKDGPGTA